MTAAATDSPIWGHKDPPCGICGLPYSKHEEMRCPHRPPYLWTERKADGQCFGCEADVEVGEPYCAECLCEVDGQ